MLKTTRFAKNLGKSGSGKRAGKFTMAASARERSFPGVPGKLFNLRPLSMFNTSHSGLATDA